VTGYDPNTGKFYGTPAPTASGSGSGYATADAAAAVSYAAYDPAAQAAMYEPTPAVLDANGEIVQPKAKKAPTGRRATVIRKGGGKTWEDTTLIDWDPSVLSLSGIPLTRELTRQSGTDCSWAMCRMTSTSVP
jgi:hypothetical protein